MYWNYEITKEDTRRCPRAENSDLCTLQKQRRQVKAGEMSVEEMQREEHVRKDW
jgi:hypothetical protein